MNDYWCIPSKEDADFVACMEDVLDVYELPYDPMRPVVCMDEKPYQLLDDVREPLPVRPGNNQKIDSEYKRNGTCSIFAFVEPLGGKHHVSVHEHRTAIDWAHEIKYLSDEMFPEAEKIILVMDNLNTHKAASLYKAFPPAEARRIIKRLEIHYTPKHGSWLDMAEIELNVMTRQCLSRRIATIDKLKSELSAWETKRKIHKIKVVKKIHGDECFYGLGDKTGFLNKRGYEYINWNTDNPQPHVDSFKKLYKSIPFFITLRKDAVFGLFFDNTYCSYFNFGKESENYYWFGADNGNLDYYFVGGESMKTVVSEYTKMTGRAPLPQMWTLGYHQSRWGYRCEEDVRKVARLMREHKIPCDAIHLDIDYMNGYRVFTVDEQRFPNMKKLAEDLSKDGIRLVTIIDPGVKAEKSYTIYDEGAEKDYFAKASDGNFYENVVWPGNSVYPDFGRSEVREWWGNHHKFLIENGIAGIWTDMNEPAGFRGEIPEDVVFYDEKRKSNHREMHNVYGHNMARATYTALRELTGKRPFVITRACYSGTQKYSTAWTGDNHSIWAHLQMAIPQMCNMGLSGMPYIGTDIGGFGSDTTKELLCRWIEVGCFSPLCRNHSSADTIFQEPWLWGETTLRIYRKFLKLRYMLLPYYYDLCKKEEEEGTPMLRPLVFNYEQDEEVKNLNGEFMLGDSLLVAPVVEQGMTNKLVYLPKGIWYDFWTGEKLEGGQYMVRKAALEECPIFVKGGSIIPMMAPGICLSDQMGEELYLDIYPDESGQVNDYLHYQDNGEDFAYLKGEYNLYRFGYKNKVCIEEMLHHGYCKKYKKVNKMNIDTKTNFLK